MTIALKNKSLSIHQIIHSKAIEIATRYKSAEAELMNILDQVERHKVYLHHGHTSLFQYGVRELLLSESIVYNLITVMRKARLVPELKQEIELGNITLSNARRIVPILTSQNHSEWIQKASQLTQRALEKEIVKVNPASATPENARYINPDRIKVELGLPEKEMIKLRRAQDLVSQSQSKHSNLEETIIALTDFYLKNKDPLAKAKRIYVKKGLPTTSTKDSTPTNKLVSIQVKKYREPIPATILHQVNLRDLRKCCYLNAENKPCNQTRWTEIHHILPVSLGGQNTLDNLTTLCSAHHKWIHKK